ncbi:DUF4011 domain-containing protein [Paeniglutamicibacter cryotolerans]|uniref:Ribosomal protein L32E n=1 Tax=Paeniglutamicibacter cryotolerans TaxID=670079 RepID=A0A839QE33_9MICC|nr:DUF4011 domain-containing protein [Paeniglutamicibacter cryotolerans]MBB2993853.1 ribosomal protein L32E [Paeniglutamicibacter cryotolerans]
MTASEENQGGRLTEWLETLGPGVGTDTLLRFAGSTSNCIDLTHAHPSGLAQFMAGRKTRLSTLLRDNDQYVIARRTAEALRGKIRELWDERGIDVGYLAAGIADWRATSEGRNEQFSAPVMLGRIVMSVREDQEDFEIQLMGRAEMSPALLRYLKRQHAVDVDEDALNGAAYMTARFDPARAMDVLRHQVADMPGIVIGHRLLISTFADLADPADPQLLDTANPVIASLLDAGAGVSAPVREPGISVQSSDERNPADELLVLDADESQQGALDLVEAGESVAVCAPAGSGQTQTAINAAAILAAQGKRVLVVAERRATAEEFVGRFAKLGLEGTALLLSPEFDPEDLRTQLTRGILRNERATEPQLAKLHQSLVSHRHALLEHVRSLHSSRPRWGCSPYQAMQELARLTSLSPAPATTVRLKRSVLDGITSREETAAKLHRAAEVGSFLKASAKSPWYGSRLRNRRDTETALELIEGLGKDLPVLREHMGKVAAHSEIRLADTYAKWGEQLQLLVAVRGSLDRFEPDIFDKEVDDLIRATASSAWRRERGIEMSSITRSRLRRVAKEYVRPGVHIADLQTALEDVRAQHILWKQHATSQRHPMVPAGLLDVSEGYMDALRRLEKLSGLLPGDAEPLLELPTDRLGELMDALLADKEALGVLPERNLLEEQLREHGLGELMDDFRSREVTPDEVHSELELAWWQSALEAMISGDDFLAMADGKKLRQLEAEYRLADSAHIDSGASRLRWALNRRWKAALADHRAASKELRALLNDGEPSLSLLAGLGDHLVNALAPVWVGSPLLIPAAVPEAMKFDAVILLEADSLSLRSVLGSISRSAQVIAFGDSMLGAPNAFEVSIDPTASTRSPRIPISAMQALERVLPIRRLGTVYRGVDEGLTETLSHAFYDDSLTRLPSARGLGNGTPALSVEHVPDGTGMPGLAGEGVETTVAEVQRVVDLVFSHIRRRPHLSLAVIAGNPTHAARIAEAIRVQLPNYPWAAQFFKRSDNERFLVATLERAHGMVRDTVLFALGYGRTPHGKAVHEFGLLSGAIGNELFVNAVTRSRESLVLVSALRPQDLDMNRIHGGARRYVELVGRVLAGDSGMAGKTMPASDPLVADLMHRLVDRGAVVTQHYRGVLDIAAHVVDVKGTGGAAPLAVVYDGTDAYRQLTVRERSRLRPQLFERLGWRYAPLWTIDVFSDPGTVAETLAGYLGLGIVAEATADGKPVQSLQRQ